MTGSHDPYLLEIQSDHRSRSLCGVEVNDIVGREVSSPRALSCGLPRSLDYLLRPFYNGED